MYFSKAVIAAIMALTLVQGIPVKPRCDECGGKGKLNSDERTVYVGPPGDPKSIFIFPSHEACVQGKLGKRFRRLRIPEYMLEDRCKPIKEFCNKCPASEKFKPGGELFGKNPHAMMGEEIVRACGDHCGITYPEENENINVEGAKEVVEETKEEKAVEEKPAEGKLVELIEAKPAEEEKSGEEKTVEEEAAEEDPVGEEESVKEDPVKEE
ncbi:3aac77ac-909f-48ef-b839-e5e003823361 [Sclerotinia trifoliorum]|uniref:3aac77ac-909f-48ef-b839-e5e003823361 n=1 Tax=Sclerotinia trifoliorum TaxID=28548 RepID=A0A8H2VTZ5_9HELO|nr:3aac77ac-909f-48ef-b839-e5e003823361 [Sclerotinia trifoliorum]